MSERQQLLKETMSARERAEGLLKQLMQAKSVSEHPGEGGYRDLYKRVTGASSLDNAIAATRLTLDQYSRVLTELEQMEPDDELAMSKRGPVTLSGIPDGLPGLAARARA